MLTHASVISLAELASRVAAEPAVGECIARRLFVYTHGREPTDADACTLSLARERLSESQGPFASILAAFVEAPAFRLRRSP